MTNPFSSKLHMHADRVSEWQKTGDTVPVTCEIDLSNRCTDRCPCCAGGRTRAQVELQTDRAASLLKELKDIGVRGLIFTGGGEPLCHKNAPTLIGRAQSLGFDVGLITNGVLAEMPRLWPVFRALTWIRYSLDAASDDMYLKTHGTVNFQRVCKNIRAAATLRGDSTAPTLGVGYLVSAETLDEMERAAKLCARLGVDYLQYRPFHHAVADSGLPQHALERYRAAQKYNTDSFNVVWSEHKFRAMLASPGKPARPYGKCYGQAFAATIGADGNVYLCCHLRGMKGYVLGNIYEQSFSDIWHGSKRAHVIENLNFRDCVPVCRCDAFNVTLWNMKHSPPEHVNFL